MDMTPKKGASTIAIRALDLQAPEPFNHGSVRPSWVPVKASWAMAVAEEYGLSPPEEVLRLQRTEANSTAFLLTSAGSRYVLRLWGIRNSERLALLEVARNFAIDHGLPGPRSLCTASGGVFCAREGRLATLTPYVDGEYFRGDLDALASAAALQASFHRVLHDFPLASHLSQGAPHADMDAEAEGIWRAVNTRSEAFDLVAKTALEEAESWPDPKPDLGKLPRQAGHFDWNPQNLLFRPGTAEVEALLDYDFAAVAERALDVALGMHKFARVFGAKTEARQDLGSDLPERCGIYLDAYAETSPLSPAEIEAIPFLLFSQARRNILFILHKHYFVGDVSSDYDLPKQHVLLREALALRGLE